MLEICLFPFLVIILAAIRPELGASAFASISECARRLAASNRRAVITVGLVSLAINIALTVLLGVPVPKVHDEFSYLLMGDTFAHGRLTNPTHPMWIHFETVHIIQQPTYASKYPVGQGLVLATGQLAGGHPIVGVWLSTAVACAAVCWMLLAFVPRPWALLGGLLAAIHPEIAMRWGQSYWGGAVAMTGGALALGAIRRITETGRSRDGVLIALGLAILANSRPYEGLVFSLPLTGVLLAWLVRRWRANGRPAAVRVALPVTCVLMLAAAFMAYYNSRVTGDPWRLPYQVHEATYGAAPVFVWQQAHPPPVYHHPVLREFHVGWALSVHAGQQSFGDWMSAVKDKLWTLIQTFEWSSLLTIPLVALPKVFRRDRWARFAVLVGAGFIAALMPTTWLYTHYAAPAIGLFLLLLVQCLRELRSWRTSRRPAEIFLVNGTLVLLALSFSLHVAEEARRPRKGWQYDRDATLRQLEGYGGKQLVFVRRAVGYDPHVEWVYNAADIDNARVVLAREMTPERNRQLLDYFKGRRAWLVDFSVHPTVAVPYPRPGDEKTKP